MKPPYNAIVNDIPKILATTLFCPGLICRLGQTFHWFFVTKAGGGRSSSANVKEHIKGCNRQEMTFARHPRSSLYIQKFQSPFPSGAAELLVRVFCKSEGNEYKCGLFARAALKIVMLSLQLPAKALCSLTRVVSEVSADAHLVPADRFFPCLSNGPHRIAASTGTSVLRDRDTNMLTRQHQT